MVTKPNPPALQEYDSAVLGTVALDHINHALLIIDQTLLPNRLEYRSLTEIQSIWQAIRQLQVRGAPAIGVAAAIGIYLAARSIQTSDFHEFLATYRKASQYLATARPTAVNLFWALNRMERVVMINKDLPIQSIVDHLRQEAVAIRSEDIAVCRSIGDHGQALLTNGDGILTHCNAGRLAAVQYGTALAPVYRAQENGMRIKVYADETRPLLQGARLTAYELQTAGIETTLICDNMASQVMKNGWIQSVFVGCDRLAANGDACNKIGTSGLAILARHYGIPFYVCAPVSTIDFAAPDGEAIPIEQRDAAEITELWYADRMAPSDIAVYNPAFDVADHTLISAIITEHGIARPPFQESLATLKPRSMQ